MNIAGLRHLRRALALAIFGGACAVASPPAALALDRPATPATFPGVFAAAGAGDTILLGSGHYGTFRGALKHGTVTIRPQPGATAAMEVAFNPASNIALDGLRLDDVEMEDHRTKNITVRNSTIVGQTILRTGSLANANIVFDRNVHAAWDKCGNCAEARFHLPERTGEPSGITIQNSRFGPGGNSDGIQNGSNGTRILDNEFVGIQQVDGADGVHADSIQLYGSRNTVIRGNYFHDVAVGIMCADGCDHEVIEDNVFDVNGSPYAVTLLSDDGSVLRHNTFAGEGVCDYDQRCGVLYLGNKSSDPPSRGTILEDNIITRVCVCAGHQSGLAHQDHNLLRSDGSGANDRRGVPTYVGGTRPSSYAGFALAAGSSGKGDASDGTDRGARIGASRSMPAARRASAAPAVRVRSSLRGAVSTGRLALAIRTSRAGVLRIRVSLRPGRPRSRSAGHSRKLIKLRTLNLGRRSAGTHRVYVRLPRMTRLRLRRSRDARLSVRYRTGAGSWRTVSKLRLQR